MATDLTRPGLADSRSPFLQHGAKQPVAWLPWSEQAFRLAREHDKPILLDIGAVWCHWCHVMDRESYENADIAALINELFVPVKVDRDERPDVDARYQRAVQALTGQGGWPLTAFLTPDGEPFYGGTYFPPADRYGRPGLPRVLREVARIWREDRARALAAAQSLGERLVEIADSAAVAGRPSREIVNDAVEALAQLFDFRHGGFGSAPKFPNAGGLQLLLDHHLGDGPDWSRRIVDETLRAMARGGVYDQLGGGFHRYSVDARWIVPHFEKMAYDNGVLLEVYARAAAALDDAEYAAVASGIVDSYFELTPALLKAGGFPASQDADITDEDDGDYWTWTRAEIREAVGGDERLEQVAVLHFGLDDPAGAMHLDPDRHVLFRAMDPAQLAERLSVGAEEAARLMSEARARMKRARDARPRPYVDETVYVGWTAMVAAGFLAAARHLERDDAGEAALRALQRIWDEGRAGDLLVHRLGDDEPGFLDDQAHAAKAFLDAFEYTQSAEWFERARVLTDAALGRYADDDGALRDRPRDVPAPVAALERPHRPILDSPEPSGNGVAALVLLRLHALTEDERYRTAAERLLAAFAGMAAQIGTAAATYVRAVDWATAAHTSLVVVDEADGALWRAALRAYHPRSVLRRLAPGGEPMEKLPAAVAAMLTGEAPRAYVCSRATCAAPVAQPDELRTLLRTFRG